MDLNNAYQTVVRKLGEWLDTLILMLPNIAAALLILLLFYFIARTFKKISYKVLNRITRNDTVNSLISKIVFTAAVAVGLFFALGVLKLDQAVVSLLAGLGVLGIALSFAFQDMAANFMSGIVLAIERPFKVNDIIETNNFFGTVKKINLRTTNILTKQGQIVLIPNKEVFLNPLINYSITGMRRADVKVGVSYGDDLEKVKSVALEAVKNIQGQAEGKYPEIFYEELGESSVNFNLRVWITYHVNKDYKTAVSEIIMNLKKAFDQNNITIPFPIRTLDFGIKGGEKLSDILKNNREKREE